MLAKFDKLFHEFSTRIDTKNIERLLNVDKQIEILFKESVESGCFKNSEELRTILDKHQDLTNQVSALKKSTFEQLAQYQKNQKNLKKYQNV